MVGRQAKHKTGAMALELADESYCQILWIGVSRGLLITS